MSDLWLDTWWEHLGHPGRRFALHVPPWGVPLPLLRERRRGLRCLRAAGGSSLRCALRCAADELVQVGPALVSALACRRDWDWLELDRLLLPQAHTLAQALRGAGLSAECAAPVRQRYLPLQGPGARVAAAANPALIAELTRKERALRRRGCLEFELVTAPEPAAVHFEACLRLEAAGWKGRAGTAMLSLPAKAAMYRALVPRLAAAGTLRLALLRLDRRLLAFGLNTVYAGAMAGIKVGYDEAPGSRQFSPGQLLQWLTLRWAHAQGLREFDFLGADDAAKADWTPHFRELARLRALNRTWRGRAAAFALRRRRRSRHHGACAPAELSAPSSS